MNFGRALDGLVNQSMGLFGLADQGRELATSQSDRLMMTNTGNTTSITQRAVAPASMGETQPEKFRSALDIPASKETVAEKGYVVALGDWTTSQYEGQPLAEVHFPKVFKDKSYAIFGMLNYHEYIRCGIDITVQVNPTEWQIGGLICWIESCQDQNAQLLTNYGNLLTYSSDIINCNVNNEVRLKQAFTFSRNLYELHQDSTQPEDIFCLRIAVWSALKVASGTSTKVSWKVTASLADVEVHGIRVAAQMLRSPYSPARAMLIGAGIGSLNASNAAEMPTGAHLTMGCEGFEMDASFAGGVECDSLDYHLRTPCRFYRCEWSTTKVAGSLLAHFKVHPRQPAIDYSTWPASGKCSTNISLISTLYRYWRGDLIFTFQVYASKWHSGRLMIAFTPGHKEYINNSTSLKIVSTCSAAQYDIHGPQSTFVYRVPYISAVQYQDCDPTTGFTGHLYVYAYTQMSAPSTVSTTVDIVCYISGAENFELFVPSYNALQAGGDESHEETVKDVAAAPTTSHGGATPTLKTYKESPVGALEMPQYEPSAAGTFPELTDGTRLHKKKHTDLSVLLGRAHHWVSFMYTGAQSFIHDESLNWNKMVGLLEAVSKCFTLFRGGLKVIVTIETLFQAEVYLCFRPRGVEPITTLEQMYKYGIVSFSTEQTHQVVLKLPWYQPIAGNAIFSEKDGQFGYLSIAAVTSGTVKVHYAVAFDTDSRFYTPRGCPTDNHFKMSTKSSKMRMNRSLPDAIHSEEKSKSGKAEKSDRMRMSPGEQEPEFLRSSMSRKGMYDEPKAEPAEPHKVVTVIENAARRILGAPQPPVVNVTLPVMPQMANPTGHLLCCRPSARYPIDHYFIRLEDGRQYGFESEHGELYGTGVVVEEFNDDYTVVCQASAVAEAVQFIVGRYYRDYNFVTYNCEHWARAYAGLREESTQSQKIMAFIGVAAIPAVVAANMVAQAGSDTEAAEGSDSDDEIPKPGEAEWRTAWFEFTGWCVETISCLRFGGQKLNVTLAQVPSLATEVFECVCKDADCRSASTLQQCKDIFLQKAKAPTEPQGVFDKFKKNATQKVVDKVADNVSPAVEDAVKEKMGDVLGRAQKDVTDWLKKNLMPTLQSKGLKIARKVMDFLVDLAQAACLMHVAISYPVPGVVGPIALATSLGALRGMGKLVMKLTAEKEQMDSEMDVTEEMAALVYECVLRLVPPEMEPQGAKDGFIEKVRGFNIVASGVKNVIVLAKWLSECVMKAVDYILPTARSKALKKLTKMEEELAMVAMVHTKCAGDYSKLSDPNLSELCDITMEMWRHATGAQHMLKDRDLVRRLTRIYTDFVHEQSSRKIMGDGVPRVEPVVIWLHGPKGSGKTLASMAVACAICRHLGVDPKKEIYTKPVSAKYYDGYKQQRVMVMDDVGQNCGANATDFDDFCQLVSTAPLRLNMAELEKKGIQFRTPIIVASSNIPDPKPNGITDTDAITRRICDHRYGVTPKDAYLRRIAGSGTLDQPSGVLDVEAAIKDGVLSSMKCCTFHTGTTKGTVCSLNDIVDKATKSLDKKTQIHANLLDMWYTMVEQSASDGMVEQSAGDQKGNHRKQMLRQVCESLGLPTDDLSPAKIVPTWTRVLLGLTLAASMVAGLASVGVAVWGVSAMSAGSRKSPAQGAYNVTPVRQQVIKVPTATVNMEQSVSDMVVLLRQHVVPVGHRRGEQIHYKVNGLMVRDLQMLVPRHFITQKRKDPLLVMSRGAEFEYEHDSLTITELEWEGKETDVVLVTLPTGGATAYKDITKHFVKAVDVIRLDGSSGVLVTNGRYGETMIPESNLEFYTETTYGQEVQYNPAGVFIGKAATTDGMCGGGLVSAVNKIQNAILGVHVAGNGIRATTQVVTCEMLLQREQMLSRIQKIRECPPMGMSTKTAYQPSCYAPYFNSGKIPAMLSQNAKCDQNIFAVAVSKYNHAITNPPSNWHHFEQWFLQWACGKFGTTRGELSISEAINGIDGLDGINMATSPGHPWVSMNMRKKDLIKWDGARWRATEMFVEAVRTHREEVADIERPFGSHEQWTKELYEWDPPMQYITYYKDELRPTAKVMAGKTRIIEAAPVHHVVAFRQVFGKAMALLHQQSIDTGFAPGCDIEAEATDLEILSLKHRWAYDADYAGFDGSLQPFVMRSAMRVLAAIGGVDPVSSEAWASLLVKSDHVFHGLKLSIFGSMPSGSPATTVINTISNLMMAYYTIQEVTGVYSQLLYSKNVVVAYGDDLLIFTSDEVLTGKMEEWVEVQRRVFSADVTSPDKTGPPRVTPWHEIVFLKRTFRRHCGSLWACLDKDSIEAMIEWSHGAEKHSDRVQAALRFAAAWGPTWYSKFATRLRSTEQVLGTEPTLIPPYQFYLEENARRRM